MEGHEEERNGTVEELTKKLHTLWEKHGRLPTKIVNRLVPDLLVEIVSACHVGLTCELLANVSDDTLFDMLRHHPPKVVADSVCTRLAELWGYPC